MGYSEDEFGYRLWDLVDKKVVRNQDVVFLEDKTIADWKKQKLETIAKSTLTTNRYNRIRVGQLRETDRL